MSSAAKIPPKAGIEQEKIDHIKTSVDMVALAEAKGIQLKKNGRSYFGLCPFHNDKNPSLSINPKTNLWQCFGCGAAGDVIRFIELFDQVDFVEAVKRLSGNGASKGHTAKKKPATPKAPTKNTPQPLTAEQLKLFTRVIDFYHTAFGEDDRARVYLEGRGLKDKSLHAAYKTGFVNGTLLNVLPQDNDITAQLQALGILNDKGHEFFYGCVVFPVFDQNGDPCGLYGRRLESMSTGADHLYLPGQRRGVFNWQVAKAHKTLILTESIIDALTLIHAGIRNVVPCYGVNGLIKDHVSLFKQQETKLISICFDADDPGRQAAQEISATLQAEGIKADIINLPDGRDINDFFLLTAEPDKAFAALLPDAEAEASQPEPAETVNKTEAGFVLTRDSRAYEVRGLVKKETRLKATVKAVKGEGANRRVWPDTVDFYSARSRSALARGLRDLFGQDEATIDNDIQRLLTLAENYRQPEGQPEDKAPTMTDKERAEALRFLKNPEMFDEILTDYETLGYTGEEMNKLLCYIAAVSRKMEYPLSVMIQSRSAAGKSFLQDTTLAMMPEEDQTKYTRLTDQVLFYKGKDSLKHKILAIEELDGMNGAIYSIRSIQSSKKITIAYTGKDAATGEQDARENTVEGPVMVFITTTQVDIDGETASRFVFISVDESEAMTKKILAKQRQSQTMAGMVNKLQAEQIKKKHRNASRLLEPLYVFNPYAELLTFTSKSLRARRDHTKYLNLILAVAYLFQHQRKTKTMTVEDRTIEYINVTLADIEKANRIAGEILGRTLDELPPPSKKLLLLIKAMCERHTRDATEEYHFTRRDIREFSGWSDFQIRTHIRQLEDLEYLYSVMGKRGKEYVYELVYDGGGEDGHPFLIGLIDTEELKQKAKAANIDGE